jgi:hypothetical protein
MFERLHRILLFAVAVIVIFFVVSSFSFSSRLAEGISPCYKIHPAKNIIFTLQIMQPSRGGYDGGYSMAGSLSFILLFLQPSHSYGVHPPTIEDKSHHIFWIECVMLTSVLVSTLAMSDEIAQDEEDAEDYDTEALELRTRAMDDDDDATLVGRRGPDTVSDGIVFEIGEEDAGSDDEESPTKKNRGRSSLEGAQHEREELVGQRGRDRND